MSDASTDPKPQPKRATAARSRRQRLAARQAKAERNVKLFNLLKAGVPIAEIALREGLSVRRAREAVQEMLERRELDPPSGFVQLQVGRLGDAMMVAHAAMMEGNMQALDRVLRIVGQLDRYHCFVGAKAEPPAGATRTLAASPSALALPAPTDAAEESIAEV